MILGKVEETGVGAGGGWRGMNQQGWWGGGAGPEPRGRVRATRLRLRLRLFDSSALRFSSATGDAPATESGQAAQARPGAAKEATGKAPLRKKRPKQRCCICRSFAYGHLRHNVRAKAIHRYKKEPKELTLLHMQRFSLHRCFSCFILTPKCPKCCESSWVLPQ